MAPCWLYIASELCKYLHTLIAATDVVDVYVQHIKCRVDFFKIGFYPKKLFGDMVSAWETQVVGKA
jgi:hypothetical protein